MEAPGQVPCPVQRDLLRRDHVGIDFDQGFGDAPVVEAALPAATVMDIVGCNPHRRVLFVQP